MLNLTVAKTSINLSSASYSTCFFELILKIGKYFLDPTLYSFNIYSFSGDSYLTYFSIERGFMVFTQKEHKGVSINTYSVKYVSIFG